MLVVLDRVCEVQAAKEVVGGEMRTGEYRRALECFGPDRTEVGIGEKGVELIV